MRRIGRIAFAFVAWLFLVGVVVQVFFAGIGLFGRGIDPFSLHVQLGWLLHIGPLPVLLLAWAAGAGRATIWLSVALLILVGIQPFLPAMRTDLPFVAALHPVNALAIFGLAAIVARRSWALARQPTAAATIAPEAAEGSVVRP
jgi:hypothetical protein